MKPMAVETMSPPRAPPPNALPTAPQIAAIMIGVCSQTISAGPCAFQRPASFSSIVAMELAGSFWTIRPSDTPISPRLSDRDSARWPAECKNGFWTARPVLFRSGNRRRG
jgi:hypothetical protein